MTEGGGHRGQGLKGADGPGRRWPCLTHLGHQDDVRLLGEPGRLIIGVGHQDRDLFCHLRRGRGVGTQGSDAFLG